jgi:hypothetical protein
MKLQTIKEPYLEFGRGTDVCPRRGIAQYDVYDSRFDARRDRILVGAVGTGNNLEQLSQWLKRCSGYIPAAPNSKQPNLRVAFPGFNKEIGFKASFAIADEITKKLYDSDIKPILRIKKWNARIEAAVDLYYRNIKFLAQNRVIDVVVCVIPDELYKEISKEPKLSAEETIEDDNADDNIESNFRRALKARAMHLGKPLQLVREASFESTLETEAKNKQDDATKAWNFCTALYYKANQTVPWRLITNKSKPQVCYVGIGFYRSRDRKVLNTSLAQIFDELGNNVILRGTPVDIDKDDRKPHLTDEQAYDLLTQALSEYKTAMETSPARLVLHKSSNYNDAEMDGFQHAMDDASVRTADFITIMDTNIKAYRSGDYPPYRGTHIEFDKKTHLLYTRGSVEFYKTYTGMYVPQPLEIRIVQADEAPSVICGEILNLTKMNWNNTQFDGKYPITIQCARRVGQVMKYLAPNEHPQISYSFYM